MIANETLANQTMADGVTVSKHIILRIYPVSQPARTDINPIARLNYGVQIYNTPCNQIEGIQMMEVWTIFVLSWVYDLIIYFYELFFLTITCKSTRHWLLQLIILVIYIALLIAPIVSAITMAISSIFFIYYCIGVAVYFINKSRLSNHQYTENMVPKKQAPPFQGRNQFFEIQAKQVQPFYERINKITFYRNLCARGKTQFMAYSETFVPSGFQYIVSVRQIVFHIIFIVVAILGLVLSVTAFPGAYGKK